MPLIDGSSSSGTVELGLSGLSTSDMLYPIVVGFTAPATLCKLQVPEVRAAAGGSLSFSATASLVVDSYVIA